MKKINIVSILASLVMILVTYAGYELYERKVPKERSIKVGIIYDGDESAPYTANFVKSKRQIEAEYGAKVQFVEKTCISDENAESVLRELCREDCNLIFTTSYGYGEAAKKLAAEYPDIEFCQATCANANDDPVLDNYHTFMGHIYEGRYIAGVAAGMKLSELIKEGVLKPGDIKIGYVAAFPYAEVISGYTAFFLGVRSECPDAVMYVRYTNTWESYSKEKECTEKLLDEGCVLISQHSDTTGPAAACEARSGSQIVFHVGYNQSMMDVAPKTSLISTKINWTPYMKTAVDACINGYKIESRVDATIHGHDAGAGFDKDWVQMVELNTLIATEGTEERIEELKEKFIKGSIKVFEGDYTGTNPMDREDVYDLSEGYVENQDSSAPTFHYVLDDVIIEEK